MLRLENEFRDSLLIKLPSNSGNMNEKDYRHQVIPGGYETYEREIKANSGKKLNRDGQSTNFQLIILIKNLKNNFFIFSESSQEQNFKREMHR